MEVLSKKQWTPTYNQIALGIILILHGVGLYQILVNKEYQLMESSNIIILISTVLCLIPEFKRFEKVWLPFLAVYFLGFIVEMIGVNTGLLFGDYSYSNSLGIKILETPLIIGVLWLSLSVGIQAFLQQFFTHKWLIFLAGATFMLFFDILLEPIAIHFKLWTWESENVPLFNYFCWFLFAFIMQIILWKSVDSKSLFKYLFFVNLFFFLGLYLSI